jgi:hypothetical protein
VARHGHLGDVLPPVPEEVWRENLQAVARALGADGGAAHI